jgi:hypothetical protein
MMKVKRVASYGQPEDQEARMDAMIGEFLRKILDSYRLIGNPKLERCFISVHRGHDNGFPISRITEFNTVPEFLNEEYGPDLWKRRRERLQHYLEAPGGREQITNALESGARTLTLSMREVPIFDDQTEWSVEVHWRKVDGRKQRRGLE